MMQVKVVTENFYEITSDMLVFPVYESESITGILAELNTRLGNILQGLFESGEFRGKANETCYIGLAAGLATARLLLVGLGKAEKFTERKICEAAGTVARFIKGKKLGRVAVVLRPDTAKAARCFLEGFIIGSFDMDAYKTDRREMKVTVLELIVPPDAVDEVERGMFKGKVYGEATNFARSLSNEPGSNLTPKGMAMKARQIAAKYGLGIEVYGEEQMAEFGMGAILGVSRGSDEEAQLIVVRYEHPEARKDELLALIGKGITFDSGGLSLKTSEGMEKMKYDMSGAAAVLGAICAIAELKPSVNVVGVLACAENMPSGKALKPGDVIRAMSGRTIEVNNTDAEGRLVLADAITFARQHLGVTRIVDVATLTGAVSIAFGQVYAAVLGNDQLMIDALCRAASEAGERLWQLPLDEEYGKALESDIADCRNSGGKPAGTINGAFFLKAFAADTPWAHIDIASTGWNMENKPYICKGPTGVAVRTLSEWVLSRA
ncbi:MAG: leucyl aminopeptidase [Acidobacteriota bacterium]|nr:leucyl aminopeptidase [Blastocatellia bacterium]MDW8411969.1 leucyl aminopeptidase [Acidobacteriota bacterium]